MKAVAALCVFLALAAPCFGRSLLAPTAAPPTAAGVTDVDLLNFALNLEYLEAEFYSCAAFGTPLNSELRGGGPASTGCQKAALGPDIQEIAEEIARDETAHVALLRRTLGSDAVPIPQLNLGTAFSTAANAAVGETLNPAFSPYANDLFFLAGAFIFEDVGVTAYAGAASLIQDESYLVAAAQILAVEAYHGGIVRSLLYGNRLANTPYNATVADVIDAISNLRNEADGTSDSDQSIVTATANGEQATLVPADGNGLVFTRTPSQVINIVTLGSGQNGGGFFPQGLNGLFAANGAATESTS